MRISKEDVLRVAQLAHLELSPAEVDLYLGQLDEILNYIAKLEQLDVTQVEPLSQVLPAIGAGNSAAAPGSELRDDVVGPCDVAQAVLAQAPDAVKPFFRVPKVIER